jgi:hypothetical protein
LLRVTFLASGVFYICRVIAFLVGVPMVLVHFWVAGAPVGVSVSGWMMLAEGW